MDVEPADALHPLPCAACRLQLRSSDFVALCFRIAAVSRRRASSQPHEPRHKTSRIRRFQASKSVFGPDSLVSWLVRCKDLSRDCSLLTETAVGCRQMC